MSKKRFDRVRLQARPKHYKQAGAVEEALRRRGVTAHVKPSWTGSLIVQVADPDATAGYLDAHAEAMADALLADSVFISSGRRDFIVAPEWRGPDDSDEAEEEAAWPLTDDPQPEPDTPTEPQPTPASLSAVDALDAFLHGYKMGRLAGALEDLRRCLVLSGPRDDGGYELRLDADRNSDEVRAQLRSRSAALAAALGADACRIAGSGRQIVITPVSPAVAHQGA
jgi:hypothetical protein